MFQHARNCIHSRDAEFVRKLCCVLYGEETNGIADSRSRRDEEVAAILADPLLAEIATLLPHLDSLHRTLI